MMKYNFVNLRVSQLVTLQNAHSDADMLLGILQKFTKKRFLRTILHGHYHK